MQYLTSSVLPYEGHIQIRIVLKFVVFAALGSLLIVAHSFAMLILVALGSVMTLAIQERAHRMDAMRITPPFNRDGLYVDDGGAFPGTQPEDRVRIARPSVIDGGSLERLRH